MYTIERREIRSLLTRNIFIHAATDYEILPASNTHQLALRQTQKRHVSLPSRPRSITKLLYQLNTDFIPLYSLLSALLTEIHSKGVLSSLHNV